LLTLTGQACQQPIAIGYSMNTLLLNKFDNMLNNPEIKSPVYRI